MAQPVVCQESNITRGLAWFQVFPSALPCSVVKSLARIFWLWERLSACRSLPRPVFHLQLPGFDWVTVQPSPVSPSPSAWPAEEALCVVILGLRREEAPSFCPQPGVWGHQETMGVRGWGLLSCALLGTPGSYLSSRALGSLSWEVPGCCERSSPLGF